MKLFTKIPLHIFILSALVLGAIFGSIFSIDQHLLNITYKSQFTGTDTLSAIRNWNKARFLLVNPTTRDTTKVAEFGANEQIQIINTYKSKKKADNTNFFLQFEFENIPNYINFHYIKSISKQSTIATEIKPIGTIFIRLLSFLAIPLVLASLIVGAASLDDIKKLGRIGGKTLLIYLSTTALAITIGLFCANIIKPGEKISGESKNRLLGTFQEETSSKMVEKIDVDVIDFFVNIVPTNPIEAMANGNMLQIVFFAVLFGITITFIDKRKAGIMTDFFSGVSDTMIKMVDFIMMIAPFGVFALISATVADFGFDILSTLIWYMAAVLIGLFIHTVFVYSAMVKFMGKMKIGFFFKGMRNAQAIAFSTSSSGATLPVTMECVEKNLGVPKQISGFVLPLGATINMDGTALYQGVAAVFIAQVYGIELGLSEQITIVLTAVLASIGTAPVPGVGIIMLIMILQAIHVPPEGIALIIGVDRILDMSRTITNISGDAAVAVVVHQSEK